MHISTTPTEIYAYCKKGQIRYVPRITTNRKNKLKPTDIEVLSLVYFRFRTFKQQVRKSTIAQVLQTSERTVARCLTRLQTLGYVQSEIAKGTNAWSPIVDAVQWYEGFVRGGSGDPCTYRYYPLQVDTLTTNMLRAYWLVVSLDTNNKWHGKPTVCRTGLATMLATTRKAIGVACRNMRAAGMVAYDDDDPTKWTLLEWWGKSATETPPTEALSIPTTVRTIPDIDDVVKPIDPLDWIQTDDEDPDQQFLKMFPPEPSWRAAYQSSLGRG